MPEFIQDPRRTPRTQVRCSASVVSAHGAFEAITEDVGGRGCQLVSPRLVRKGEPIQLVVGHEAMREVLRVGARVAWASERAPFRLGVAYDEAAAAQTQAWFEALVSRIPGLSAFRRVPDRIAVDALVYLSSPPRFLVDFSPDEVALLRGIGSGTSVAELRALLRDRWQGVQRALFSLLAHQHVTLARGASVHPDAWRKCLSEAESELAVEGLQSSAPAAPAAAPPRSAPVLQPPVPRGPPAGAPLAPAPPPAPPQLSVPFDPGPEAQHGWLASAAELSPPWQGVPSAPGASSSPPGMAGPGPGLDAGPWAAGPPPLTGGFVPAQARSPEAQGSYQRALAELEAGRMAGAAALLRRALALAPGDPEISATLARLVERQQR